MRRAGCAIRQLLPLPRSALGRAERGRGQIHRCPKAYPASSNVRGRRSALVSKAHVVARPSLDLLTAECSANVYGTSGVTYNIEHANWTDGVHDFARVLRGAGTIHIKILEQEYAIVACGRNSL